MPQKYKKAGVVVPGFLSDPEREKAMRETLERATENAKRVRRKRQFMAEPEELRILDTIAKLPPFQRAAAAEGMLIARRYRALGRPK